MVVTPQQFAQFSPDAHIADATIHALCGEGDGANSHLAQTLAAHGLTEPSVAAQFLAACYLASKGFTSFIAPHAVGLTHVQFQSPESWIEARACDWTTWRLTNDAEEWDFNLIVDQFARQFKVARSYPEIWDTLDRVCNALNIRNEFALGEII